MLQCPVKTCYVGRTESEFACALDKMQTQRELRLTLTHNLSRAIGRAIVDDEHIEAAIERKHHIYHSRDVLNLVIGGYDYKLFQF